MKISSKWKRIIIVLLISVIAIVAVVIIFISPIAKYLVEKHSEEYSGRKIKIGWLYLNPFTGFAHFSDLKVYEAKSDSVFFSAKSLSVDFAMMKLFNKTYEISDISIDGLQSTIIQYERNNFNFNDLVEKFSPKNKTDTLKEPVHFNIFNIQITNSEFRYKQPHINVDYFVRDINLESAGKRWDVDTIASKLSFSSGPSTGDIKAVSTINLKTLDYSTKAVIKKFDLSFFEQYILDLANYSYFKANLDADITATGNFHDQLALKASGQASINDFHLGKSVTDQYLSFDQLQSSISELNPLDNKYIFDSLILVHPTFKYERYDSLDNIQQMFGRKGSNVTDAHHDPTRFNLILEIADYVKVIVENFLHSYYKIDRVAINRADLKFNDFSTREKFSIAASPLYLSADSIDKSDKRVRIAIKSGVQPYGTILLNLSVNPNDYGDFDLTYGINKLSLPMLNPYFITYTSFPLDRGTVDFNGIWKVRNSFIESSNHLLVLDPRVHARIKSKDAKWIPLPLVMAFVRERSNVIDYEIPVTGDMKNPKFRLKNVIIDLLENILIKPPSIPYMVHVREQERKIEKSQYVQWDLRESRLTELQEKFVGKIADFLKENASAELDVYPNQFEEKEKEYLLLFEAKKKYFLMTQRNNAKVLNEQDSLAVEKMSVKDPSFVNYVTKWAGNQLTFTIQEKCQSFVGLALVNADFDHLKKARTNVFLSFFEKDGTDKRLHIHAAENTIPYNGFSFYKISYKGEIPKDLVKAYEEMNNIDSNAPRKKYRKKRREEELTGVK